MSPISLTHKLTAELIGTFTLVFIGTATAVLAGSGILGSNGMGILAIAFAFGFTLIVLVYAIGPISGCHINPAVSIAMWAAKKLSFKETVLYSLVQILGGIVASAILLAIMVGFTGDPTGGVAAYSKSAFGLGANGVPSFVSVNTVLGFEIVLTALFIWVILLVTSKDSQFSVAGLAIGGFLFVAHLIGVPLGDASLNPARSIGPALLQGGAALGSLWVFIAGPIMGGLLGVGLYTLTRNRGRLKGL